MKKAKTNKLLQIFTLLLLSGLLWCCTDERERYDTPDADKLKTVTFSVKVPGGSTPKTYALAEGDENEVSSIAILLFDGDGNYTYQPIYSNTISTDPSDSKIKTFTVDVPEGTYNIMILANANASLTAALSSINAGDPKASVVSKLLLSNSGKWNATPGSAGYVPIPMWGEITGLAVSGSMAANIPVTLIRMISKIDVSLGTDAKDKFNLQSVRLYNYNDQGQIAPTATNWSSATHTATAPSVPTSAQKPATPADSPLLFDGTAIAKDLDDRGISCADEIYTFEAPAGSSSALSSNTCLVVGGVYDGDTQATYYRIDLANITGAGASATTTYLALLRNHRYKINITDVKSSGFPTHKDAFNSRPINIAATVVEWDEALITHIAYNEQYLLGVSKDEFTFTREARTVDSDDNTLYVTTDYPGGWSVQKIIDDGGADVNSATNPTNGWLSLSPTTGASGATAPTQLLLTENNTSQTRTAYIHLAAGRLSYIVKVQQGVYAELALSITDAGGSPIDVLEFPFTLKNVAEGTAPAAQTFNLNWSPASYSLQFGTMANGSFVFASGSGLDNIPASGTLTSGSKSYTIQAPVISQAQMDAEPFYERSSIYLYSISDGMATINKSLTLRQRLYNLVADVQNKYWLDGSTYTFYVRSSAGWQIKSLSQTLTQGTGSLLNLQASDNLRVGTIGGINTGVGTPVTFSVANQSSGLIGKISVLFGSTDSPQRFDDVIVTINLMGEYYPDPHKGWAGSNIYWDGSKLTFDDVDVETNEQYQGVYFEWGSLTGQSPAGDYSTSSTRLYLPGATTPTTGTAWADLPYVKDDVTVTFAPPAGKENRDRCYLHELAFTNGTGDICKYITEHSPNGLLHGKRWRMPTSKEFDEVKANDYAKNSGTFGGAITPSNAIGYAGKYSLSSGFTKTADIGSPYFPANGCRNLGSTLYNVGKAGYYWSATPSGTFSFDLSFIIFNGTPTVYTNNVGGRPLAYSVRCVVE